VVSAAIYTVFVGLTFDVLVAEQQTGGHGTRELYAEISDDVTQSLSGCVPAFVV